jgi:hypothetical protein
MLEQLSPNVAHENAAMTLAVPVTNGYANYERLLF